MMERRQDHTGDVIAMRAQQPVKCVQVVPVKLMDVDAVLIDQSRMTWRTPGVHAVISLGHLQDLAASGVFAGNLHGPGRHVGTILAKYAPRREIDQRYQVLGKLDHDLAGMIDA